MWGQGKKVEVGFFGDAPLDSYPVLNSFKCSMDDDEEQHIRKIHWGKTRPQASGSSFLLFTRQKRPYADKYVLTQLRWQGGMWCTSICLYLLMKQQKRSVLCCCLHD